MRYCLLYSLFSLTFSLWAGEKADTALLRNHLTVITKTNGYRNYTNTSLLNKTAEYIYREFAKYADTVCYQEYVVNGRVYKNVICSFGTGHKKRIVVGAHYDVCENQEGADDNASGVAGLLELARMLKSKNLGHRIDLVAYSLEEPPFFRTEFMGSYIHAKSLADAKAEVYGMISLEMIGYFKDEKRTQHYPIGFLKLFYGSRGNYITLVQKNFPGKFVRRFFKGFKQTHTVRTKRFRGPKILPGVDFSDHLNYWKFGFGAMMITDTSFYRNANYHEKGDTMETLDLKRMAGVIDGVYETILCLK